MSSNKDYNVFLPWQAAVASAAAACLFIIILSLPQHLYRVSNLNSFPFRCLKFLKV